MSTLKVSTISNAAGSASTSSDNVINGSAKAWVNLDGTGTVGIRASYNVSSITDNGTGDYTVNFTTAMSDTNYAAMQSYGYVSGDGYDWCISQELSSSKTTSACRIRVASYSASALVDVYSLYVSIFR
jgi:hypothetical protein